MGRDEIHMEGGGGQEDELKRYIIWMGEMRKKKFMGVRLRLGPFKNKNNSANIQPYLEFTFGQ